MACPSREDLENVMHGKLPFDEVERLAKHVEHCGSCETTLQDIKSNDTLVPILKSPPDATAPDSVLHEVAKRLRRKPGDPETVSMEEVADAVPRNLLAPAQADDEIGRLGAYRILQVLGAGGMGMVFLAHDPNLDRKVALKVMLPKFAANEAAKQRFLREARTAANLHNDHVVTIHQVGEENGVPFLAMELLQGSSLDEYAKGRTIAIKAVLRIGREVAKGLAAAHARGLIHRDIKPGNIWLDSNAKRVKLLDFGLARNEKDDIHITQSGAIVGTPAYMSPEQARGDRAVDARSDLFSLGCVLYRLSTGDIPFKSETTMGVLLAIAMNDPPAPADVDPRVPRSLSDLVMRLLAKNPADRPASATDVIAELEKLERDPSDPSITARPANRAATKKSPERRTGAASRSALRRPAARPTKPPTRSYWPVAVALGAIAFSALLILGAWVLRFETERGTLVVEIADKDVEARFKNGKLVLVSDGKDRYTIFPNTRKTKIDDGDYTIRVEGADGLTLDTKQFTMTRNDQVTVRVRLEERVANLPAPPGKPNVVSPSQAGDYELEFLSRSQVKIPAPLVATLVEAQEFTLEAYATPHQIQYDDAAGVITLFGFVGIDLLPGKGGWSITEFGKPNIAGTPAELHKRVHIALVSTREQYKLYIDGRLKLTRDTPLKDRRATATSDLVWLGGLGKVTYIGKLDEVRISKGVRYDRDFTPAPKHEPDADTLALYHCDEGEGKVLQDRSAHKRHAAVEKATWVRAPRPSLPLAERHLKFDGTSAHVLLPTLKLNADQPVTFEMRVKFDGSNRPAVATETIIGRLTPESGLLLARVSGSGLAFMARKNLKVKFSGMGAAIDDGEWRHVAAVWTGTDGKLFIDGKQIGKTLENAIPQNVADMQNQRTLMLGGEAMVAGFPTSNFFGGLMDEIRISKVARYPKNFDPAARFEPDADTLALFHCDEGQGDQLVDSSGNNNHGRIVGVKWIDAPTK